MTPQFPQCERPRDAWFSPPELHDDLKGTGLPDEMVAETLACAWEYIRCVVPEFIDWDRYLALVRTVALGTVVEFRGAMADVSAGDHLLGYDLNELLDTLFRGTPGHEDMAREYRTFLLITAEKTSDRRGSELFRRYANALSRSPRDWFRLRDCDALARFVIAGAMACNELGDAWFREDEFEILTEIGVTLYDAVAYYKHRAEGETHNTFAYAGADLRIDCYRRCREVLWALDTARVRQPKYRCAINFLRCFGGPIHMMMRRYRFAEDRLTVGMPETEHVVHQTRQNYKLWFRSEACAGSPQGPSYQDVTAQEERLLFPGFLDVLERSGTPRCGRCRYRHAYGAEAWGTFGGVELCDSCRAGWHTYLANFTERAEQVFSLSPTV
ncbi:hypothetical protein ACGFOU_11775 [Streptomyces sp. NPDC048595]|uniref:hypothetical protein n=1 Tax=Streptomyces sp. NPDC048595 TaxID=3365576 RepID=UPI00372074F9